MGNRRTKDIEERTKKEEDKKEVTGAFSTKDKHRST
jgi:hypothetical protein